MKALRTSPTANRPTRGRPALPPHIKRSHTLEVALNESEREQIEEQAKRRGMPPSAYLRDRGLGLALPRAIPADGFNAGQLDAINKLWLTTSKLRHDLAPLANNVNQLAHQANAGRYQEATIEAISRELAPLVEQLRHLEADAVKLMQAAGASDDR